MHHAPHTTHYALLADWQYNGLMNELLLIYGKLIVDNIQLRSGEIVPGRLGGGGPQAAFGMRLWHSPVALLTRSGTDLEPVHQQTLEALDLDLSGWQRYPNLLTPRSLIVYDDQEYMQNHGVAMQRVDWFRLLDQRLTLTASQQQARGIHLITELPAEPMVHTALDLRQSGAFVSLEPIFASHSCDDPEALLGLVRQVDLVTPDWPAATMFTADRQPLDVLRYWSTLGPKAIAIRHGARGSYVWDADHQRFWHIPGLPVNVVDPTGAGNAYGGGWCAGWHLTHDARLAGCYATAAAALVVSSAGMPELTSATRQRAAELLDLAIAATTELRT